MAVMVLLPQMALYWMIQWNKWIEIRINEHEDTDGEKDEGEIVVSAVSFGIVEEVNNYPSDEGIDGETDDEVHHGLCQL